jgi:hypothetical protein
MNRSMCQLTRPSYSVFWVCSQPCRHPSIPTFATLLDSCQKNHRDISPLPPSRVRRRAPTCSISMPHVCVLFAILSFCSINRPLCCPTKPHPLLMDLLRQVPCAPLFTSRCITSHETHLPVPRETLCSFKMAFCGATKYDGSRIKVPSFGVTCASVQGGESTVNTELRMNTQKSMTGNSLKGRSSALRTSDADEK